MASDLYRDRRACDRARLARDPRFDGRFFTGVLTTRIYCRPTCPVKPARSRNVVFFPTAAAAERAGFRPCLRCRPEAAPGSPAWRGAAATGLARAATDRPRIPGRRRAGRGARGQARHDDSTPPPTVPATCRSLAHRRRDDPPGPARQGAGGRDRDADVRDRVRRGLREHPPLQRRVSRRLPEAAERDSPGATPARSVGELVEGATVNRAAEPPRSLVALTHVMYALRA